MIQVLDESATTLERKGSDGSHAQDMDGKSAPPQDPFFVNNLAALRSWAPHLNSRLSAVTAPHGKLIRDDGLDMELLGERFYGMDARQFADEQIDMFFRTDRRYVMSRPDPARIKGVAGDFAIRMTERMEDAGLATDMK